MIQAGVGALFPVEIPPPFDEEEVVMRVFMAMDAARERVPLAPDAPEKTGAKG